MARTYYDGDTFEHGGAEFKVTFPYDDHHGAPWDESDGHGVVTDWEHACETPRGCWELCSDRRAKRFYNWRETMDIAKRDGWGLAPDALASLAKRLGREPSKRDIRKEAVRRDFNYLHSWCNDQWSYVGVVVELLDADGEEAGESESLWGVESFGDYASEVALELAGEILARMGADKDAAVMDAG